MSPVYQVCPRCQQPHLPRTECVKCAAQEAREDLQETLHWSKKRLNVADICEDIGRKFTELSEELRREME